MIHGIENQKSTNISATKKCICVFRTLPKGYKADKVQFQCCQMNIDKV